MELDLFTSSVIQSLKTVDGVASGYGFFYLKVDKSLLVHLKLEVWLG
jgi:hypothetical protein